jgi:hypothetical protein
VPNNCSALGALSKVLVEGGSTPRTFDVNSERIGILMETMQRIQPFQGRRRITGDLSQYASAIRPHSYLASGALVIQAGAADFNRWLPRVMWGTTTTGGGASTYQMGTNADSHKFDILIDRENAIFRYTDCQIARAVIRSTTEGGQQPQNEELVEMILYIYAIEEEIDGTTWPDPEPALVLDGAFSPYAHWEGALTVNSHATPFRNFELTIDNRLQPIWYSSITPNCFRSQGRLVTLKTENPFTATTIDDAEAMLSAGVAANLLFTHSDDSFTTNFQFAHLRNNYKTPTVGGRGEIPLELNMEAFRTSSTAELIVVNDFTPTP